MIHRGHKFIGQLILLQRPQRLFDCVELFRHGNAEVQVREKTALMAQFANRCLNTIGQCLLKAERQLIVREAGESGNASARARSALLWSRAANDRRRRRRRGCDGGLRLPVNATR